MRALTPRILLVLVVLGASAARAQERDAGTPSNEGAGGAPEQEPEEKRPRLVKPEGDRADNVQLGGEPSLTELGTSPDAVPEEACDLDCIEAQLAAEEEEEKQRKGIRRMGEETGAVTAVTEAGKGDTLAAEPSTTTLEQAKALAPEGWTLPMRLGPVRIRVGQTEDWVGIGFATQMEFQDQEVFPGADAERSSSQRLEFRRIRFTLSSSFIEGRIQSRFQINLTPSQFELVDMWFSFTRFKFATVRIGQFKIPYDRYRAQSFAALSLIDWAPTTRMFGSERQVGMEMLAFGAFLGLEYSVGVFSGTNARGSHGVGITEVYGEVPQNPSDFASGQFISAFHPELAGRVAKNFGPIDTDTNSDVLGTKELRHSLGAGVAWDARPEAVEDLGLRLSAEWLGKISRFHVNLISYLAWYDPWEGGNILFGPMGFMGEVGYRFTIIWELALRYSTTYLTPWLRSDARSYGAFQIETATDRDAAIAQYGDNGRQITNDELALAGTAHIIGNSLKAVAQVAWTSQLWDVGRQNGIRLNLQLQFLF
ncbi:MAG: hypothetical protein AMS21_00345 [Gemmatimonas sp. SG8_38_2]|nr:MAG: hypothetical protein AMS21_00345 [Gemmatimonas sp. SG8_38_2]